MEVDQTNLTAWSRRIEETFGDCGEDLSDFLLTWPEVKLEKMTAYCACAAVVLHLHTAIKLAYINLVIAIGDEQANAEKKSVLQELLKTIREALRTAQESRTWLEYNMVLDPANDRDAKALRSISYLGQWIGETLCGVSALMVELDEIAARQLECDASE